MLYFRLLNESLLFAYNALVVNKLRTFLSLLGITIGIFAIISVFAMVDSLERKVRESVSSLGDNIIFVHKWPWTFGSDYPWWKYWQRPVPTIKEMEEIKRKAFLAEAISFNITTKKTVSYKNSSIESISVLAVSQEFNRVRNLKIEKGRYFSETESAGGKNIVITGSDIAAVFFPGIDPIGKEIKIMGRKYHIIGVFEKEGESMLGESMDTQVLIPLNNGRNFLDITSENVNPQIMVKAADGVSNEELKEELRSIMRGVRKLKPIAEDDFALNETSLISNSFDQLFGIINIAGGFIGIFSIIVGGFGIANIMFVSVKERTSIIGLQKSLGAKNFFILFQFLSEAVILCIIGGAIGLSIIFAGTFVVKYVLDFDVALSLKNVFTGIMISVAIGLVSGIVPAYMASRLDPVEAIRSV
jgi:putative ABC transport system permease protein